jgi:hypothetical protein
VRTAPLSRTGDIHAGQGPALAPMTSSGADDCWFDPRTTGSRATTVVEGAIFPPHGGDLHEAPTASCASSSGRPIAPLASGTRSGMP